MKLHLLFPDHQCPIDTDILSLTNDSRKADKNSLFIAYAGFEKDLHQYIFSAYQNGCRCFMIDKSRIQEFQTLDACIIPVDNLKSETARIALLFYNYPDQELTIIGITGTNGKTTTATLINQALNNLGFETAFFGTVEWSIGSQKLPALNTTPDLLDLVKFFRDAVDQGIKYVVMEVASHALSLGRVEGIAFDIVGFTNLTQDHLDYHQTFDHYFEAKKYLFTELLAHSTKKNKKAFINADDEFGAKLIEILDAKNISYTSISLEEKGYWNAKNVIQKLSSTNFMISNQELEINVDMLLLGLFNVYNFLMAYAILSHLNVESDKILDAMKNISVPGRLQKFISNDGVVFLIDYAHTPDALSKAIGTVQETLSSNNKSIVVFGAGGDRDRTKRPLMAKASRLADIVIVTSDNPRTEDPQLIINDILEGFEKDLENVYQEINRSHAIAFAYQLANKDDIILIAGKGHEDYQIIGTEKHYFSDFEEAKKVSK